MIIPIEAEIGRRMLNWNTSALVDDIRPLVAHLVAARYPFALATIAHAEGGPRQVGTQMVITHDQAWGFLSGGCIEDDVALHGRDVIQTGLPKRLVYGAGSPFVDMRLPCGGTIHVLVESVGPDDAAIKCLLEFWLNRLPAFWVSDGTKRLCLGARGLVDVGSDAVLVPYVPAQRLIVVGSDPYGLSIAQLGQAMGWETVLVSPFGPNADAPFGLNCVRTSAGQAILDLKPDQWTAIALATHDVDIDEEAIMAALASDVGYIGLLGSRRRLPDRLDRLRSLNASERSLARVHAPIGLPIGAASPREVAAAVVAEIIHAARVISHPALELNEASNSVVAEMRREFFGTSTANVA